MERVTVAVPDAPYDVLVGDGVLAEVATLLAGRRQVAIVTQQGILAALGGAVPWPGDAGTSSDVVLMGEGEGAKSLDTVDALCRAFAQHGLLRGDAVVALGGGVVGDTAGFAAAVYHRGVAVVQAPTTLLAQVDAAIGGKTAVNLPEGKNLVGAFHQPAAVVADVATLATLPPREFHAGLGEVAKYALMPEGHDVAEILRERTAAVLAREGAALTALVAACVRIKADVVARDPWERTGVRATLNYGHTFAHALETVGGYGLLHGEAVAVGLAFADALALATERIDPATYAEHGALLDSLGLHRKVPEALGAQEYLRAMQRDKKAKGGLTFVLPGPSGLQLVDDPPPNALAAAFMAVGVDPT